MVDERKAGLQVVAVEAWTQESKRTCTLPGEMMANYMTKEHKAWVRGFAAAIARIARYPSGPDLAHVLRESGITDKDLEVAEVEAHDRAPLQRILGTADR